MKNWKTRVLSIVLGLTVLAPTASFAVDNDTASKDMPFKKGFAHYQRFDSEQQSAIKDKILDTVSKYMPEDMAEWENALAEQEQLMGELKEKAPVLRQKPELSDEVKEKIQTIRDQVQDGTLTREQAREEMQNLGLVKERFNRQKPEISDEVKEKIQTIRDQVQDGTLTREQAREEMQHLGFNKLRQHNIFSDLQEAIEANDESQIRELLPQLLEHLQERNQQLSVRLENIN